MDRRTASFAVLVVAAMTVVAVPAAGLGPGGIAGDQGPADDVDDVDDGERNATNARTPANGTNNGTPPGSTLTGVVGVQEAEIEGEVQSRGFEIALNGSNSKATVVGDQVTDLESRLEALRERKNELDRAREGGNITKGEYRARIAEVSARIATVQRLANQTVSASRGIPEDELRENGVNASRIQKLKSDARNLSGQEVAEIARSIAGPGVGKGLGRGPPDNRTNPGQGNGPNPGQGDGMNPGQGDGMNPGQGDGMNPGQENGPGSDGGSGNGESGTVATGPEDEPPAGNETKPDNGGSDGDGDGAPTSVSDTPYAGALDGVAVPPRR